MACLPAEAARPHTCQPTKSALHGSSSAACSLVREHRWLCAGSGLASCCSRVCCVRAQRDCSALLSRQRRRVLGGPALSRGRGRPQVADAQRAGAPDANGAISIREPGADAGAGAEPMSARTQADADYARQLQAKMDAAEARGGPRRARSPTQSFPCAFVLEAGQVCRCSPLLFGVAPGARDGFSACTPRACHDARQPPGARGRSGAARRRARPTSRSARARLRTTTPSPSSMSTCARARRRRAPRRPCPCRCPSMHSLAHAAHCARIALLPHGQQRRLACGSNPPASPALTRAARARAQLEAETDELLLLDEDMLDADPEQLPHRMLSDFAIYNAEARARRRRAPAPAACAAAPRDPGTPQTRCGSLAAGAPPPASLSMSTSALSLWAGAAADLAQVRAARARALAPPRCDAAQRRPSLTGRGAGRAC